jgi:hypothetical protein
MVVAASGAVIVENISTYPVTDFTVADGVAISKGALLSGSNLRAAVASTDTTTTQEFVGIAAADKEASDGATNLGAYTTGIHEMQSVAIIGAEGAITVGDLVQLSGANTIVKAGAATVFPLSAGVIVGRAQESIAAGNSGEVKIGIFN